MIFFLTTITLIFPQPDFDPGHRQAILQAILLIKSIKHQPWREGEGGGANIISSGFGGGREIN